MLRRTLLVTGVVLLLTAAPAAAGGGGCHQPVTDGSGTTVAISQFCFSPTVVRVPVGETVTWSNSDGSDHNVVSAAFRGDARSFGKGESYDVTFNDAGVFPYVCSIHPGMVGAVVVGDADTPLSPATGAVTANPAPPEKVAVPINDSAIEQRLAAVEASLLSSPGPQSTWPPLAVGLVAGLALGVLGARIRRPA
jgi:plastocyanin